MLIDPWDGIKQVFEEEEVFLLNIIEINFVGGFLFLDALSIFLVDVIEI